jgi:hypothetical protein
MAIGNSFTVIAANHLDHSIGLACTHIVGCFAQIHEIQEILALPDTMNVQYVVILSASSNWSFYPREESRGAVI